MKIRIDDDGEIKRCRVELFAWLNHAPTDPECAKQLRVIRALIKHHPSIPDEGGLKTDLSACGGSASEEYGIEWDTMWNVPVAVYTTYGQDNVCLKAFCRLQYVAEDMLTKLFEEFSAYSTFAEIQKEIQRETAAV